MTVSSEQRGGKVVLSGPDGILGSVGYMFFVQFLQPYHHIAKTDTDSEKMNKMPMSQLKMYLQKWGSGTLKFFYGSKSILSY